MDLVAIAVVRGDEPQVLLADDMDTLHWALALRLVARTPASELTEHARRDLRQALLDERWADAVVAWMDATGNVVDVYPTHRVDTAATVEMAAAELQFTPLFSDVNPREVDADLQAGSGGPRVGDIGDPPAGGEGGD